MGGSSIIYAGVGGTGPWNDDQYFLENGPETFVRRIGLEWQHDGEVYYERGPGVDGAGTNTTIANRVRSYVVNRKAKLGDDCAGVVLAGHSRGAAAVTVAAQMLSSMHDIQVDVLLGMDPVNMTPSGASYIIPTNVKQAYILRRDPATKSRATWSNACRTWMSAYTKCEVSTVFGTHASIGGQTWLPDPTQGEDERSYIYENTYYEPATAVTFGRDAQARLEAWNWMAPRLSISCNRLLDASTKNQGIGKLPPIGTGNGNGTPNGKQYTVVSGDSLSLISGRMWQDVLLWPILYDANRTVVGPDPNRIVPGQKLTVPSIAGMSQSQLSAARTRGRSC